MRMTTREAAQYANRTKRTLSNWRQWGILTGERQADGSWLFTEEELDQAMERSADRYLNRNVGGRPRSL